MRILLWHVHGAWTTAFLGAYGQYGLGVTDGSEGNGTGNSHKVDNIGDRNNYILFEFSKPVVVTKYQPMERKY